MSIKVVRNLQKELARTQRKLRDLHCVHQQELAFHAHQVETLSRQLAIAESKWFTNLNSYKVFHYAYAVVAQRLENKNISLGKSLWIRSEVLYNRVYMPALMDWSKGHFAESESIQAE